MMLAQSQSSSLAHLTFSLRSCNITSVSFHLSFSLSSGGVWWSGSGSSLVCSLVRQAIIRGMLPWNFIIFWWWLRHCRGERVLMQLLMRTLILRVLRQRQSELNRCPHSTRNCMQARFQASPQKDQLYFLAGRGKGLWDQGGGSRLRECLSRGMQLSSFWESEYDSSQLLDEEWGRLRGWEERRDISYAIFIIGREGRRISGAVKGANDKIRNGDGWNGKGGEGRRWSHHYFLNVFQMIVENASVFETKKYNENRVESANMVQYAPFVLVCCSQFHRMTFGCILCLLLLLLRFENTNFSQGAGRDDLVAWSAVALHTNNTEIIGCDFNSNFPISIIWNLVFG